MTRAAQTKQSPSQPPLDLVAALGGNIRGPCEEVDGFGDAVGRMTV